MQITLVLWIPRAVVLKLWTKLEHQFASNERYEHEMQPEGKKISLRSSFAREKMKKYIYKKNKKKEWCVACNGRTRSYKGSCSSLMWSTTLFSHWAGDIPFLSHSQKKSGKKNHQRQILPCFTRKTCKTKIWKHTMVRERSDPQKNFKKISKKKKTFFFSLSKVEINQVLIDLNEIWQTSVTRPTCSFQKAVKMITFRVHVWNRFLPQILW